MYKGNFLEMVRCLCERVFCTWKYTLGHCWHQSETLCFEPSQITTVTNCDISGIPTIAICGLSQFVVKAVTAQTRHIESNNTEKVLRRVPMFTFDMNTISCIFAHFGVISLLYLFVCMYISYNAHNRCTRETFLLGSGVDANMFSALRSIPSVTIDINLRSCILNRHKMRQSQITTNQESLLSQFVICRNLWSSPCRGKFSPITLKMCSVYLGEYPCSLLTGIWEVEFWIIFVVFAIYIVYNSPNMSCRNDPRECV